MSEALPNAERAIVEPAKVRDYLLSPTHPIGRFKAVVFASLGYTRDDWEELRTDLLAIARTGEASVATSGPFGQKFQVSGMLTGPSGRTGLFTTVWLVRPGEDVPRFITAFPT